MSTSLECRLLCASVTTYSVLSDGPIIPPPPPYFDAAQFIDDPPVGFVGGIDAINEAYAKRVVKKFSVLACRYS
jgi:hypothetical protein